MPCSDTLKGFGWGGEGYSRKGRRKGAWAVLDRPGESSDRGVCFGNHQLAQSACSVFVLARNFLDQEIHQWIDFLLCSYDLSPLKFRRAPVKRSEVAQTINAFDHKSFPGSKRLQTVVVFLYILTLGNKLHCPTYTGTKKVL
jgi:hypothetical protein